MSAQPPAPLCVRAGREWKKLILIVLLPGYPAPQGSGRRPSHHHLLSRATEKLLGSRAGVSPQVKGPDKEGLEERSGVSCWGWACTEDSMTSLFFVFLSSCNRSNGAQHPYRVSAFGLNLEEEGKWDPEMKSNLRVSSVASRD